MKKIMIIALCLYVAGCVDNNIEVCGTPDGYGWADGMCGTLVVLPSNDSDGHVNEPDTSDGSPYNGVRLKDQLESGGGDTSDESDQDQIEISEDMTATVDVINYDIGQEPDVQSVDVPDDTTQIVDEDVVDFDIGSDVKEKDTLYDIHSQDANGDDTGYDIYDAQGADAVSTDSVPGLCASNLDCDDGNSCTYDDNCVAGKCVGKNTICDDKNPCTSDNCDTEKGCVYTNHTEPCSDNSVCTVGDACANGKCKSGKEISCEDGNVCTGDYCHYINNCVHLSIEFTKCTDDDACTADDICKSGVCTAGKQKYCNDQNPCTIDSCDKVSGECKFINNTKVCDDLSVCTKSDVCKGGKCAGEEIVCDDGDICTTDFCHFKSGCSTGFNSEQCNDNLLCTKDDTCASGKCVGTQIDCEDGEVCTQNSCESGKCVSSSVDVDCTDNNKCTTDKCSNGKCVGTQNSCDDGNVCTTDSCEKNTGCQHANNADSCNDNNVCTQKDVCESGSCKAGDTKKCDDANVCTDDTCDAEKDCMYILNIQPCSDGDPCTSDSCVNTKCVGVPNAGCINCSSASECKSTQCVVGACNEGMCDFEKLTGKTCDDGHACTTKDLCKVGVCVGAVAPNCNDSNPCTDDSCDKAKGCQFIQNTKLCDDGNACTISDVCESEKCAGQVKSCDDNNQCTNDTCNPVTGCVYTPVEDLSLCSDGNLCTIDACKGGNCMGTIKDCDDKQVCTSDVCDEKSGSCVYAPSSGSCSDGNSCTLSDQCKNGKCQSGSLKTCDDGNSCTSDTCDTGSGVCKFDNNSVQCNDGNACTKDDVCGGGVCKSGDVVVCNDSNPCTDDSCDKAKGCQFIQNTKLCDDSNACTISDVCADGSCVSGKVKTCDDGDKCTSNLCDNKTGICTNKPIIGCGGNCATSGDCNDVNSCTADVCVSAKCSYIKIACDDSNACTIDSCNTSTGCINVNIICNDSNPCTNDSCDKVKGCQFIQNTKLCDDGNACTNDDKCIGGKCQSGSPKICNDNNICTDDSCTKGSGWCKFQNNTIECEKSESYCTIVYCKDGTCPKILAVMKCNDNNICTDDSCKDFKDCVHAPNNKLCTDNSKCTNDDFCKDSKCSGSAQNCDDTNNCTDDSCDPATGCKSTQNTTDCNDGDVCTQFDKCAGGNCTAGVKKDCDDGKQCTIDYCVPESGCKHSFKIGACDDGNKCTAGEACDGNVCKSGEVVVSTLSGSGSYGDDDGESKLAKFRKPTAVTFDDSGVAYVVDEHRVRMVAIDGTVTTHVGSTNGYLDAPGTIAKFNNIGGIVWGGSDLFVSDSNNFRIRQINAKAIVTTFAGSGTKANTDGIGAKASFSFPRGVAVTADRKTLYLADGHAVRKITVSTGEVVTFAGASKPGYKDGPTDTSRFNNLWDVALDNNGNIFVSDLGNRRIRKITNGVVYTLAGNGESGNNDGEGVVAQFVTPSDLVADYSGSVFVSDPFAYRIRKILPNGVVSTFTGSVIGHQDGVVAVAQFNLPTGLAMKAGDTVMFVTEWKGLYIRKIVFPLTNCDDGNSCTADSCNLEKGCQNIPITGCK